SGRRHTRFSHDWSSDVCSSDLAKEALALHKTRRASDLTTRSQALHEIQEALSLDDAPLRIECYDVSNLQGTNVVASMVVFEDGRSEERRVGKERGCATLVVSER